MDRVYDLLASLGYPPAGIEWLRRRRLLVIVVLGILAWLPFIGLGWLISLLLSG